MIIEEVRILIIGFCIYAVVYCVYAIKIVLIHNEVQLNRLERIKKEHFELNELYLRLTSRCEETPREKLTAKETIEEVRRLKRKLISFC
jgi:hypothetical protein